MFIFPFWLFLTDYLSNDNSLTHYTPITKEQIQQYNKFVEDVYKDIPKPKNYKPKRMR